MCDIQTFIQKMQQQHILVLGDVMLDQFIYGRVNRISPEAPVPVVHVNREAAYPGGAANVARNLAEFGISATISGLIGNDTNGNILKTVLENSGISINGLHHNEAFETIVKTRIIARHQQVVRVDREHKYKLDSRNIKNFDKSLEELVEKLDAIIIADYGKGFIVQELVDRILRHAKKYQKIVTIDPNPNNPLKWKGATLIKPNRNEALHSVNIPLDQSDIDWKQVSIGLRKKWQVDEILITLGEEGLLYINASDPPYHSATKARDVYDVSGAGDTVIAFFTAACAAGLPRIQAAEIANHAAGVVVGKVGTATVTAEELIESFNSHE